MYIALLHYSILHFIPISFIFITSSWLPPPIPPPAPSGMTRPDRTSSSRSWRSSPLHPINGRKSSSESTVVVTIIPHMPSRNAPCPFLIPFPYPCLIFDMGMTDEMLQMCDFSMTTNVLFCLKSFTVSLLSTFRLGRC